MKILVTILSAIALYNGTCVGQAALNFPQDFESGDIQVVLKFFNSYLNEFKDTAQPDYKRYFTKQDCEKYKVPDFIVFGINATYPTYKMGKPTILYIRPENNMYHIKTFFGNPATNNISVLCVTDHYVKYQNDSSLRFVNSLDVNAATFKTQTVSNITYHYPAAHSFNIGRADDLITSVRKLEAQWKLPPHHIDYYFTDTDEELKKLRGFDYCLDISNKNKPMGIAASDSLIFCSGLGEDYFHEVVHAYLNSLFPNSPLKEGLAVLYGGSMGHDLYWHYVRLRTYLAQHPGISTDTLSYIDDETNPQSILKGIICANAFKKEGIAGLKKLMGYTNMEDILKSGYKTEPADWARIFQME